MIGQDLIDYIRTKLRDFDDNSILSTNRNVFWTDDEILAALNGCQLSYCNFCIENEQKEKLLLLIDQYQINAKLWDFLPNNYLHYVSVRANKFDFDVPVKIYLGGDGFQFLNSKIDALIIFNNLITLRVGNQYGTGTLYYYKKPNQIIIGTFIDSFADYRIICDYASTLLGLKEIQTTRDFKGKKKLLQELATKPYTFANYLKDLEVITKVNDKSGSNTDNRNTA
jgi:hypothetical protein